MKLADATKEELIWWIREHAFELSRGLDRFEADILYHRYEQYNAKAALAGEQFRRAFAEYRELLEPIRESRCSPSRTMWSNVGRNWRRPWRRLIQYVSLLKGREILCHIQTGAFPLNEIGRTFFLIRAEAEAALRGEQVEGGDG